MNKKIGFCKPHEEPKKFSDISGDVSVLEGMNVFEQISENEFDSYDQLIIYSPTGLNEDGLKIIPFHQYCEDFWILSLPMAINKVEIRRLKKICDFFFMKDLDYVEYIPLTGSVYTSYNDHKIDVKEVSKHRITRDYYNSMMAFYRRYNKIYSEVNELEVSRGQLDKILDINTIVTTDQIIHDLGIKYSEVNILYSPLQILVNFSDPSAPIGSPVMIAYIFFRKNLKKMIDFLNSNYLTAIDQIHFSLGEEDSIVMGGTIDGTAGTSFRAIENKYYSGDDMVSDFIVKVQYKIEKEGKVDYIVTLIGTKIVENVIFPSLSNKTKFRDTFLSYGDFHFMGGEKLMSALHSAVAQTPAPYIKGVTGYGFHEGKVFVDNGVYDINTGMMYVRSGPYYFNEETNTGYVVLDCKGYFAQDTIDAVPSINFDCTRHTLDTYRDFFRGFFKNDFGELLLYYVLGLIYGGYFRDVPEFKFPLLILNGLKNAGKSAFSDIIKRVYGFDNISKSQLDYKESSKFVISRLLSDFSGLPVFITEFGESSGTYQENKASLLIGCFDKSNTKKGTQSQNIIKYEFGALPIIDGEELPERSALRSRALILRMNKRNQINSEEYHAKLQDPLMRDLLLDALMRKPSKEQFKRYYISVQDKFPSNWEARTRENMSMIYAGCMIFDADKSDDYIKILTKYGENQYEMDKSTAGIQELLKYICVHSDKLMYENCFFVSQGYMYIDISVLQSYFERSRSRLSLKFDDILNYFEDMDMYETQNGTGLKPYARYKIDEDFPKYLQFFPDAYQIIKNKTGF